MHQTIYFVYKEKKLDNKEGILQHNEFNRIIKQNGYYFFNSKNTKKHPILIDYFSILQIK